MVTLSLYYVDTVSNADRYSALAVCSDVLSTLPPKECEFGMIVVYDLCCSACLLFAREIKRLSCLLFISLMAQYTCMYSNSSRFAAGQ
jgi:hypothetical protein